MENKGINPMGSSEEYNGTDLQILANNFKSGLDNYRSKKETIPTDPIQYMGTGRIKKNTEIRDTIILVLSIIGFYLLGMFVVIPRFLN